MTSQSADRGWFDSGPEHQPDTRPESVPRRPANRPSDRSASRPAHRPAHAAPPRADEGAVDNEPTSALPAHRLPPIRPDFVNGTAPPPPAAEPGDRSGRRSRSRSRTTSVPVTIGSESGNDPRGRAPLGEDGAGNRAGNRAGNTAGTADATATTLLPPVVPEDRTAIIPRLHGRGQLRVAETADRNSAGNGRQAPKGVRVVPLRPVQTADGYRSVYSEVTRTTPATVARTVARGTGELLITMGLIVLLFAAYEVWGKAAIVNAEQSDLDRQLAQQFAQQPSTSASTGLGQAVPPPLAGGALARLYIPRLNKNWVVVQGVTQKDIRYAPGHYPNTAMPGEVGNFSVAGHRNRAIFWDLDLLKVGDPIVLETAQTFYVYRVTQSHVVLPNAVQVVAPVPGQPGKKPQDTMLTLTTCNPKFNNYQRLIIHAKLDPGDPSSVVQRSAGRPKEIGG